MKTVAGFVVAWLCAPTFAAIELLPGHDAEAVASQISYFVDESERYDVEALGSATFVTNERVAFNLGLVDSPIWLHVPVRNAGSEAGRWVFALNKSLFDSLVVYAVEEGGAKLVLDYHDDRARVEAFREFRTTAFELVLGPGEQRSYYLRFEAGNTTMPISIRSHLSHDRLIERKLHLIAGIIGGSSTFIVFATFPMAFIGRRIFLLFAGTQILTFVLCAHLDGVTTVYLWPEDPDGFRNFGGQVAMLLYLVSIQFARIFFRLREHNRLLDQFLRGAVYIGFAFFAGSVLALVYPDFVERFTTLPSILVGMVHFLGLPTIALYGTLRWDRNYWPIALAWATVACYAFAVLLVLQGTIPALPFGREMYAVLIYVEGLCLAIALMMRVRQVQSEHLDMQVRLGSSLSAQLAEERRALRLSEQKATALQEAGEKGQLLLAASHDARHLVSAIRANAFVMSRAGDEPDTAKQVDRLAQDLDHLLTTVVEASYGGGIDDTIVAVDTMPLQSVFESLRMIHERQAMVKELEFRIRVTPFTVTTDRVLLIRVLSNLLSNAIKYTSSGGVLLAARRQGAKIRVEIWDTGEGLTEDQLRALDGGKQHRFQGAIPGLGTGLQTARAFAERLGGQLQLTSAPGHGTRACLALEEPEPAPQRALLLDEDLAMSIPSGRGHWPAAGGTIEWRLHESDPPGETLEGVDAAIVSQDFLRPDHGLEIAARVKASYPLARVVITTYDRSADARVAFAKVCDALVYKPADPASLRYALSFSRAAE